MGLLTTLGSGQGFVKAGLLGFPKSGKSYTATILAVLVREFFELSSPIAFADTEGGSEYLAPLIEKRTGQKPVGIRSRSFDDLMTVGRECEAGGASVLIVDSITHIWRELCEAYMKRINEQLVAKRKPAKARMELQDIMRIKDLWARWPDFYLNSKLHIIICGRAGFEWGFEENEDTGKKELIKTGVKMKVESEFGFEPSLLIEMERVQDESSGKRRILHRATVLGDRFGVIDGAQADDPSAEFFMPFLQMLKPNAHAPVDVSVKSEPQVDSDGNEEWHREKRERAILTEEIQGELMRAWPGMTAVEKKAKADAVEQFFNTRSWTKVENMPSAVLRNGLVRLRSFVANIEPAKETKE